MANVKLLDNSLIISCFIGLGVSIYSYYVEIQHENYKAFCDISEVISCSKTFKSKYGTGFGLAGTLFDENSSLNAPNCLFGIAYYSLLIVLVMLSNVSKKVLVLLFGLTIFSVMLSFYLGYVMLTKINTICLVCVCTYLVNFFNCFLVRIKLNRITKEASKKRN